MSNVGLFVGREIRSLALFFPVYRYGYQKHKIDFGLTSFSPSFFKAEDMTSSHKDSHQRMNFLLQTSNGFFSSLAVFLTKCVRDAKK